MTSSARKSSRAKRSRRRLTVRYSAGEASHIGYSGNISEAGMMIRTTRVFEPGTILFLEIELLSGVIGVKGQVMWARVGELRWLPTGKIGMGIRFMEPPDNLMEVLFPSGASE